MEIKINKEIRDYTESMFFGLSLRQSIFSLLALAVAVGIYFILKPYLGIETLSWLCILGASPFAALGFINYHGMTAEQLLWAWFRTQVIVSSINIRRPRTLLIISLYLVIRCVLRLPPKASIRFMPRHTYRNFFRRGRLITARFLSVERATM